MAITVENSYTASGKKVTSVTVASVVVPASSDRYILVKVGCATKGSEDGNFVSGVTFNGSENFTLLGEAQNGKATVAVWRLKAPTDNTTADVVVTFVNNNASWEGYAITVEVLSGVDQTTSEDTWETPSEGSSTAAAHAVATASGDLVYGVVSINNSATLTENGDGAELFQASGSNNHRSAMVKFTADDASAALAYTVGSSLAWVFGGVSINPASGGGDVTLTADPSQLTLTGAVSAFTEAVESLPAALLLTGAVAVFSINTVLDAQPGALVLTGANASFATAQSADPGALALSGAVADFQIATVLVADPGALALSGADANLVKTESLDAQPGALALTGATADFIADVTATADPSQLILTGAEATFSTTGGDLDAQPGALILTGAEAIFSTSGGPTIRRRGGRFFLEGDREPEAIEELIALVEPEVAKKSAETRSLASKMTPETTIRRTATIPARKQARVTRLLAETGITLEELLAIIDL